MPTAIVTGGALRVGRAMALRLAGRGYSIALHYNSSGKRAQETITEVQDSGVHCEGIPSDFTDLGASAKLIGKVRETFSDVELLVNSASSFIQQNIENTTDETLADTFNINLFTPYLLMREYRKQIGRGMIVNILDERIEKTVPAFAAYSVSKVALAHLTRLAAVEWGETIRVNGIAPGLILPPAGETEDYLKRNAPNIPTRTHGSVEDLTRALDYLIDSPFVNGETLFVDGGESKKR